MPEDIGPLRGELFLVDGDRLVPLGRARSVTFEEQPPYGPFDCAPWALPEVVTGTIEFSPPPAHAMVAVDLRGLALYMRRRRRALERSRRNNEWMRRRGIVR